jgi:hypothetical protein
MSRTDSEVKAAIEAARRAGIHNPKVTVVFTKTITVEDAPNRDPANQQQGDKGWQDADPL